MTNQVPFVNSSWNSSVNLDQGPDASRRCSADDLHGRRPAAGDARPEARRRPQLHARRDRRVGTIDAPGAEVPIPAAIITRSMAEKLFPGQDAVGKTFYTGATDADPGHRHRRAPRPRPARPAAPSRTSYSMILPIRVPYTVGGNYLIRVGDPARRAEVLKAAVDVAEEERPQPHHPRRQHQDDRGPAPEYYREDRVDGLAAGRRVHRAAGGHRARHRRPGQLLGRSSAPSRSACAARSARRAAQILRYFQTENFLLATIGIVLGMLLAYGINQLLMGKYELPRLPAIYLPVGALVLWLLGQLAVFGPARRAAACRRRWRRGPCSARKTAPLAPTHASRREHRGERRDWPRNGAAILRRTLSYRHRATTSFSTRHTRCRRSWSSTTTPPSPPRWRCCSRCTTSPRCARDTPAAGLDAAAARDASTWSSRT